MIKSANKFTYSKCSFYKFKFKLFIFFFLCFLLIIRSEENSTAENNYYNNKITYKSKLIKDNFFVLDSNNLEEIKSHMYGFSTSKEGIITDNYYKKLGFYEEPEPQGAYVMIRKNGNQIRINQDFCGCFGLYYFENIKENYFALSNSFFLLVQFLVGRQNISINKDFTDHFILLGLSSISVQETMINEIIELPSNTVIIINIKQKKINFLYIDYKENTIPLYSKQGIKLIDNWVDKWGYIFRSLKKQTDNLYLELSGGFDTRSVFSILKNSGVNLNNIKIKSIKGNNNTVYGEDFKIVNNITSKFKLKVNNFSLDNKSIIWSLNDTLFCSIYSKLGFGNGFNFQEGFYNKPRFAFTGYGGENIRGYPGYPIKQYFQYLINQRKLNPDFKRIFYDSSMKFFERNLNLLKNGKNYNNDYEITSDFYFQGRTRHHFGKTIVESFIANIYLIHPLMDPEIKKIKYDINGENSHDLIAYIYTRFAKDLINFPIQGKRKLNYQSIIKANKLNNYAKKYRIKSDLNINFYIDIDKRSSNKLSYKNKTEFAHLKELFRTNKYIQNIKELYNNNAYKLAKKCKENKSSYPLTHCYELSTIATIIEYFFLNKNKKSMEIF